jgi:hypothetical protein
VRHRYAKFFLETLPQKEASRLDQIYDLEWEAEISALIEASGVQDAYSFRMLSRARRLSAYLIGDEGEIKVDRFPLYWDSMLDKQGTEHMGRVLSYLRDHPKALDRFRAPACSEQVRILICDSLGIPITSVIDHSEVRRAVLSALLFPLRQSVGSCFATAPAILIQSEQIESFLNDFFELLVLGKIRRTFGGESYSVPLNATWGIGDLKKPISEMIMYSPPIQEIFGGKVPELQGRTIQDFFRHHLSEVEAGRAEAVFKSYVDHALLKSWEYTVASLADYKTDFAKWNLFASLGFDHKEKGGIGAAVYAALDIKLNEWNEKLSELETEHDIAVDRVRMSQSLLSQASDTHRIRRIKGELHSHLHHLDAVRDLVDETHDMAKNVAGFYKYLMEHFQKKFEEYFQEVYDAQMQEVDDEVYDDSPAGFRLVFKHGREDPSQWTLIYNEDSFIKSLVEFFLLIEGDTIHSCEWEKGKDEVAWIIGIIVMHVREPFFVEMAFERIKKAHKERKEVQPRTPWSYIAGGSMNTLLKGYFCVEGNITREERPVENATDLCIFFLELFKEAAPDLTQPFIDHPEKGLLMYTPTHACIIRPGMDLFRKGWLDRSFTYTWVRDVLVESARRFYMQINLTTEEQRHFFSLLDENEISPSKEGVTPHEMRMLLVENASRMRQDEIDGFLRFAFPIYRREDWRLEASLVLKKIMKGNRLQKAEKFLETVEITAPFLIRNEFIDVVKMAVSQSVKGRLCKINVEEVLEGDMPPLMHFADTNWSHYNFAFGYNIGTDSLDLWRVHQNGREGVPMTVWKAYYDGSQRKPWGVMIRPFEYGGFYTRTIDIPRYKI